MKPSEVWAFEDSLKPLIQINVLYVRLAKLAGHDVAFVKVNGAWRAPVVWRKDENPSLHYHEGKNLLTDFADVSNYTGKLGRIINHIDLILLLGLADNRFAAIKYLADLVGVEIPKGLKGIAERLTREQEGLRAIWKACQDYTKVVLASPADFPLIHEVCVERCIPYDINFWEKMNMAIWPSARIVNPIIEEFKMREKDSKLTFGVPMSYESRAIVFPLHNRNNCFVGVTIRNMADKSFLKYSLDEGGAYGLQTVLAEDRALGTEGQMNVVQIAAATYRMYGKDEWKDYLPAMFATGSKNFDMSKLRGLWSDFLYAPDFDKRTLNNDKKKIEVHETVTGIYNALGSGTPRFSVYSWPDTQAYDKYDIDDFLREYVGREAEAFAKLKTFKSTIYEFMHDWIESKTSDIADSRKRDSARFAYATELSKPFYNRVDKKALLDLYSFDVDELDAEMIEEVEFTLPITIAPGLRSIGNAYFQTGEPGENGEPEGDPVQISNFVFSPRYNIISKPETKEDVGEHEGRISEIRSIHAIIRFEDRTQHPVTFEYKDLIDMKTFVGALARMSMKARMSIPVAKDALPDVFQCAMISLDSPVELVRLQAAGPHLRMDTPEHRRDTLRPDWFGKTLKTYLCRGVSVINGKIVKNRDVNLEFVAANCYSFGLYDDHEHMRISHFIWNKLRKMHRDWYIDSMLGLAAMTPIKHLLDPMANGTTVILIGKTNAHKTSTALVMSNFFGDLASESQLQNFNATPKATELKIAQAGSVFLVCDEFKSSADFTVKHLGQIIHNTYSGRSRGRLSQNSKLQETYDFTGTYVMTGEQLDEIGSSTEARCLVYRIEEYNAFDIWKEVMEPDNLQKLKCWMPRLIAWQHENSDELVDFYKERCLIQRNRLNNIANANRIAGQQALVETGVYAVGKYMEAMNVITSETRKAALQKYLIWSDQDIHMQMSRSDDTSNAKKFLQYTREMIDMNAINIAILEGDGQRKETKYSQDAKRPYQMIRFESKGEVRYAIVSFDAFIREVNKFSGTPGALLTSIRKDLAELGIVKLDAKGGFTVSEIPDPQDPKEKRKRIRALVLTHRDLYGELDDHIYSDREYQGDCESLH